MLSPRLPPTPIPWLLFGGFVAEQRGLWINPSHIPRQQCTIAHARNEQCAVGGERQRSHGGTIGVHNAKVSTSYHVPQVDRSFRHDLALTARAMTA